MSDPKTVTIYGRLSFPTWTAQEAYDYSQKGDFPAKSVADAAPNFQLLLEQPQLDKLMAKIKDEFFPYVIDREKNDPQKIDSLNEKEIAKLLADIDGDHADQSFNTPFKEIKEKTQVLAPEAVASIKIIGSKGVDMELKAIVNDESELQVPDPDLLKFPVLKPIHQTVHQMYGGCYVAVTLNMYAYRNGKNPGFSAGASVAVFKADGDRFGGGLSVDEDAIFMD